MGYTTDFDGEFIVTPALEPKHRAYLEAFSSTRRMTRDAKQASKLPDPLRKAVGLPIGTDGGYFVGDTEGEGMDAFGQSHTDDITDYNHAPEGQPGLWCQWHPSELGTAIFAEGEKFYDYIPWLQYLIDNFLTPWGYKLNGEVTWQGEEGSDQGKIQVKDSKIKVLRAKVTFVEDKPSNRSHGRG